MLKNLQKPRTDEEEIPEEQRNEILCILHQHYFHSIYSTV